MASRKRCQPTHPDSEHRRKRRRVKNTHLLEVLTIDDLPVELMRLVFACFVPEDLGTVILVSRRWRSILCGMSAGDLNFNRDIVDIFEPCDVSIHKLIAIHRYFFVNLNEIKRDLMKCIHMAMVHQHTQYFDREQTVLYGYTIYLIAPNEYGTMLTKQLLEHIPIQLRNAILTTFASTAIMCVDMINLKRLETIMTYQDAKNAIANALARHRHQTQDLPTHKTLFEYLHETYKV